VALNYYQKVITKKFTYILPPETSFFRIVQFSSSGDNLRMSCRYGYDRNRAYALQMRAVFALILG
jgi:hypothetical protein